MKTNERLYMDVHVLQTVPPSCVNRDDTGSPKTAVYGGVTRARVSSQSWKRAMRLMFMERLPKDKLSLRTKRIVGMVEDELKALGYTGDKEKAATALLKTAGLNIKSADEGTKALFFLSNAQARALAQLAMENPDVLEANPSKAVKEQAAKALKEYPGIDIALFGRMVADDPSLNTDACAQVAHSISTHKVSNEYDYFTAVDDLSPEDNAGAGHIGTVEFNSATLYRYATVAVHELYKQLKGDTVEAVTAFLHAFACAMPTGKQNTFANRTLPDAVMVTLRTDQPINLVGAFEKPVSAGEDGYVDASAARLAAHAMNTYRDFAGEPSLSLTAGRMPQGLGEALPLPKLIETLAQNLTSRLESDGERS
ncbi:MAG: type I-E CRISPR-associated protein Cas7/Cse4/CasC [Clostridiales bacterium]|nr:type I-E CRISPR-associated protein Cas7/Cse4/CasC [Clostridiales bacterium]